MNGVNFYDCYLEFQKKFKPVKYYSDQKEIVKTAMKILVDILTDPRRNRSNFVRNIRLIYPNYFTVGNNSQFRPIMDELIFFNGEDIDLKKRVLQHMSYYLTGKSTTFIRISKSLLENENLRVSSFFIQRNGYKAEKGYKVFINGNFDVGKIEYPAINNNGNFVFSIDIDDSQIKGEFKPFVDAQEMKNTFFSINVRDGRIRGAFVPCENTKPADSLYIFDSGDDKQEASDGKIEDNAVINNVTDFCNVFREPLSAHYIMLAETSLLYVYSQTAQIAKDNSSLGYGGMFVLLNRGLDFEIIKEYTKFFQLISDYISICIAHNIMRERQLRESTKSAKAAIMSRNMSHNLGSHVMFYIKQRLESVEKILQTGTLHDLVKSDSIEGIKEKIRDASTQPGEEMPFLVGLGRFINYLQERQDYIATVATDYIPYKTSISFKDAIYDELKPDLRAQRHNSDKTVKGKQPANLLLDYIAYSEGFHPSKCIKLKFGDEFDGTSQVVPNNLRKLNVALPSGNLGRQAFFSIMENVIRNTAKHDGATNGTGGILGFQFDILDSSQLDNIPFIADASDTEEEIQKERMLKRMKCYGNKQNKENYNYIGITANTEGPVRDIDGILQKIQDGIIDRYTENNGQMRDEFKGIKEMRISAAWMRGYGIDTDIPINEPPALAVRDNCGHIQYIICLPKPKKIAFVYSTHEQIKDERMPEGLKVFRTMSRYIDNSTDETEGIRRFVKDNCIADYELIVCTTEDSKRFLPYVGSRIYTCDDIEIYSLIKAIQEDDSAIADIYIKWLEQKFKCQPGGRLPKLIINDGQAYENHISDINGSRKRNVELGNDRIMFNSGDSTSNQLVYSKHYNPKEHRFYDQAPFVEGISGGNSTDRLLRQDEWTKEWYVKHMTAALTKVAIFDERIYSNFIRLSTRKWDKEDLKDWLDKHKEILKDKNPQRALLRKMDSLSKKIKTAYIEALLEKNDNGEYVFTKSDEKLTPLLPLLPRKLCTDCTIADLYRRKGVWAFNIKVEEKEYGEKCVIIVGYTKEIGEKEIARLTKGANQHDIVLDIDKEFINKFHFITIHQGILDKMYSALGIRKEEKHLITDELFDKFSKNKKEDDYLPQFIIHSGRSKPNDTDMPQKQPFIQFAALDHAVKDCKYTLTELLYSAHYE